MKGKCCFNIESREQASEGRLFTWKESTNWFWTPSTFFLSFFSSIDEPLISPFSSEGREKSVEVIKLANKLNISSWILSLLLTLKLSAPIKVPWRGAQRSNGREGSAATYRKLSSLSQQLDNHSLTNFTLIHARKKHGWMNFEESALSIINISCLIMQRFDYYRFIIMLSAPSPMPPTTTLSLPAAAYLPTSEWSDSRAERERKRVSSLADIDFFCRTRLISDIVNWMCK